MESGTEAVWIQELPEGLQRQLGIDPGESLRLVERSPTALVLERVGRVGFPARGVPSLRAEVATLPLSELLRALHRAQRSGLLRFVYRSHVKTVYLHQGEVVFASSNQRVDRLGECLLRAGVITLEQLRDAERCFSPPDRFGKVLVERGCLTPRELWNGVKYQVEEVVRSLFAYPGGEVTFWDGEVQPDNVVRLSLETGRLVAEGLQRSEELAKFLAVLDDPRVCLARVPGVDPQLAGSERAIADALGSGRHFGEVCEALGFDRASAARSVQLLRLVGAVKLLRQQSPPQDAPLPELEAPDDASLRERVSALTKLVAELTRAILEVEEGEGVLERLARVLDDATGRFPALLTGIDLGSRGELDAEQLVQRALMLPGDREAQLVAALGELVAYLEFEVKNHPAMKDPDALLESVESLRSLASP